KQGDVDHERSEKLSGEQQLVGGTPAFMAPEQAVGEPVDGRSDLYSLGCVAFWLLTGMPVFRGRTAIETMMMHVHVEADAPSTCTDRPIPSELDAIVLDCLAKEPAGRPQTADDLAARLARVRTDGEWTASRAREWWDTHRPMAGRISLPS